MTKLVALADCFAKGIHILVASFLKGAVEDILFFFSSYECCIVMCRFYQVFNILNSVVLLSKTFVNIHFINNVKKIKHAYKC